jgi:hypothetical protein
MIRILDELQSRLAEMIEFLHTKHTVCPPEGVGNISYLARINVLWYLDPFAAAVMGARLHLGRVEADEMYWEIDRTEVRVRIAKRLVQEFYGLKSVIRDYEYCLEHHCIILESVDLEIAGDDIASRDTDFMKSRRRFVTETLGEFRLLDQALEPWR